MMLERVEPSMEAALWDPRDTADASDALREDYPSTDDPRVGTYTHLRRRVPDPVCASAGVGRARCTRGSGVGTVV